ncbi:MAG: cyanophycin synthetase family protein, partial [Bacteroidia bacterium]
MKLDIGDNENFPTNKIKGFDKAIEKLIPSLREHRCSVGREGGFLQRVHEGTWLGHVVEHVALELQTLAGMDCGFGRTRSTKQKCVYHVVYAYVTERAGIYAGKAAVRIVENIAEGKTYDISEDIEELKRIYNSECLGPSTQAIADEAKRRNIPYTRLNNDSLLMLGQGANQKIICSSLAATTSSIGVDLADNKETTRQLLSASYVPVPEGLVITHEEDLKEATEEIGFPLVVKPINGNHGRGVTTNILNYEQALEAFRDAQEHSYKVIIEKFIQGTDYRFLVVNFKLVAVAKRTPAMVMGDGTSTIQQLIDIVNSDPQRGEGHEKILTRIKVDANTLKILEEKNLNLDSILPLGEILFLKDTANLSSGGTASDVTDSVHPENVFLAERIARLMNLNICGIDILAGDVITLIKQNNGAVLEVNAGPGLRMHLAPSKGLPRNVAEPILDMLYPENTSARIPVVAITGTNGKTTTTYLLRSILQEAGFKVGIIGTIQNSIGQHV